MVKENVPITKREIRQAIRQEDLVNNVARIATLAEGNYELKNAESLYLGASNRFSVEFPRLLALSVHTPVIVFRWSKAVDSHAYVNNWLGQAIDASITQLGLQGHLRFISVCIEDDEELRSNKEFQVCPDVFILWHEEFLYERLCLVPLPRTVKKSPKYPKKEDFYHDQINLIFRPIVFPETISNFLADTYEVSVSQETNGITYQSIIQDIYTDEFGSGLPVSFVQFAASLKDPSSFSSSEDEAMITPLSVTVEENPDSASGNETPVDPIEQIKKLSELHEAGVLSDEEFQAKKQVFLDLI